MVKRRVSGDDSVLLMSSQVVYGRPGSLLERIHRGEVQGTLTEYSSSAWQIGDVVGYAPMEKPRETFNAKGFFTDWSGFTWYVLGPLLRMVFWSSFFIVLMSPILFSLGFRGVGEEMAMILVIFLIPLFYFPPLILLVGFVGLVAEIWLLLLCAGKFLDAVGDAVESTRLLVRQHKIQQDFQFRLVYECTPTTVSSPAVSLRHTAEEES
ncbi:MULTISPECIES: hypothetical protein [Rothia]|jgi:hypothetical protein|uniref:hypothetical protein n=1 Tax=Rothia TaxID=32207 RepID=UPI0008A427FE|nr:MULTISPECIES: hypothetical protein [Rothia]OFR65471.1 hypothetical protein HMPREF2879_00035 [Rothia sp. HMSC069C04]